MFHSLCNLNASVTCLQETFWDDQFIECYKHLWKGRILYNNHPDSHRRGVAILLCNSFPYDVYDVKNDDQGRIQSMSFDVDETTYNVINVYLPNDVKDRALLYPKLKTYFKQDCENILAGDLNEILNPRLDCAVHMKNYSKLGSDTLQHFITSQNLVDIWRYRNPSKRVFTRTQIVEDELKQSRLDYFLISRSLICQVANCFVHYSKYSDHNPVCLRLDLSGVERGKGIWIFNNSLLKDPEYCIRLIGLVETSKSCPLFESEPILWWDNLKFKIKKMSVAFSSKKARIAKKEYFFLQNSLEREYCKAASNPQYDVATIKVLETRLEEYEDVKCKGAILRSKAQWALESDRNTSFFLKLERSKQAQNCIRELQTPKGKTRCTEDILQHVFDFYSKLYSSEDVDKVKQTELLNLINKTIPGELKDECEEPLTLDELKFSAKTMKKNKSPGGDGLTAEFYLNFWEHLGPVLHMVVTSMQSEDVMARSMRKSVISLFYKKRGDKTELKNYRPISLLCVDYKIIARALALRMKKCMNSIISPEQSACIPGRDISHNVRSICDTIDYVEECTSKQDAFLITIDQEKAFDRVPHDLIVATLGKFGFGQHFISWIKLLYTDIYSTVKCNGHLTPLFHVTRSVRQGCPLSAMLYVVISEPLNLLIKSNENITGVNIRDDSTSLLYQHADDTTATVSNLQSVQEVFKSVEYFCNATGAKVNREKSEVLLLGKARITYASVNLPAPVKTDVVKILGVYMGPDKALCEDLNWKSKIAKCKSLLCLWHNRKLSLQGKSVVINTLLLTKFWYLFSCIYVPDWAEREITLFCRNFLWGQNKPPSIKFETILGLKVDGGLNIPDIKLKKYAFRLKILKHMCDNTINTTWKCIMAYHFSRYRNMGLSYNVLSVVHHKASLITLPRFYQEVIYAWNELTLGERIKVQSLPDILNQPVFNNPHIILNEKTLFYPMFINSGISVIRDLCYEVVPGFLPPGCIVDLVLDKYPDVNHSHVYTDFKSIMEAIPQEWKHIIRTETTVSPPSFHVLCNVEGNDISPEMLSVKYCYALFQKRYYKEPTSCSYFENHFDSIDWKNVWKVVHITDKSSECIDTDFKIAHNIVYTLERLYKMGKVDSPGCQFCQGEDEDIFHIVLLCPAVVNLIDLFNEIFTDLLPDVGFTLTQLSFWLMFGYLDKNAAHFSLINILLSLYRLTVIKSRAIRLLDGGNVNIVKMFKSLTKRHFCYLHMHYKARSAVHIFTTKYIMSSNLIYFDGDNLCFTSHLC